MAKARVPVLDVGKPGRLKTQGPAEGSLSVRAACPGPGGALLPLPRALCRAPSLSALDSLAPGAPAGEVPPSRLLAGGDPGANPQGRGRPAPSRGPGAEAKNAHSPRGRGARSPGLPRAARGVPLAPRSGGRRTRGLREGSGPRRPKNASRGAPGGTGGTRPLKGTEETGFSKRSR